MTMNVYVFVICMYAYCFDKIPFLRRKYVAYIKPKIGAYS